MTIPSTTSALKASAIERYFRNAENQITIMANSPNIVYAMDSFSRSFKRVPQAEGYTKEDIQTMTAELRDYYTHDFGKKYKQENKARISGHHSPNFR